ncbi:MAG TPA: HAMP domain-containing sensor histidine kinase [Vicinamibacterales bacterium]|nr:HAMP domain-containing sensor histidine kinase [Vicinamibacterales bacterium]
MDDRHQTTVAPPSPSPPSSTPGWRAGWVGHVLDDRGIRLATGLAVVVAIPVAVLFYFQFQSINDLASTSATVLRQLSQETADAAAEDVEDTLKRPHIGVLLAIPQTRSDSLDRAWMDPVMRQGLQQSPFVEAFYVWSAVAPQLQNQMLVYNRDSLADDSTDLDRRFRRAPGVGAVVLPRLQQLLEHKRAIVAFPATIGGRRKYVQAQLRFTSADRDAIASFVALVVDADEIRTIHLPGLMKARLAKVQHLGGFPQLDLTLSDAKNEVLFTSSPHPPEAFVDQRSFPLVFFDRELLEYAAPFEVEPETWTLQTGFDNRTIVAIADSSSRPQLALMAILALVMAAGVFFVAGAAAREVRLAELKSNFVASVSHDLKTPLALIQLFAETLELGRVRTPERAAEYYRIINSEAKKLTRLIENILDFSRMEAGLRPYRTTPADLGAVTRDVVARLQSQFEQGRFNVVTRVEPGLPSVDIDADAVQQAIENVLANAMKYSRENRDIEVEVVRAGNQAAVRVTDHGIGIDKPDLRHVFRKFYRVDSGLGGGPQGCGLGLAIVDHTMRGHGGTVRVQSEPGHGSTFTLAFPLPAGTADAHGDRHEANSGDRGRATDIARSA